MGATPWPHSRPRAAPEKQKGPPRRAFFVAIETVLTLRLRTILNITH